MRVGLSIWKMNEGIFIIVHPIPNPSFLDENRITTCLGFHIPNFFNFTEQTTSYGIRITYYVPIPRTKHVVSINICRILANYNIIKTHFFLQVDGSRSGPYS